MNGFDQLIWMNTGPFLRAVLLAALAGVSFTCSTLATKPAPPWLGPTSVTAAPDGKTLYIGCAKANQVLAYNVAKEEVSRVFEMPLPPTGLVVSSDGSKLYITCAGPRSVVCVLDVESGRTVRRLRAGHTAGGPVLSPDGTRLFVCNRFNNSVSEFELASGDQVREIKVRREPVSAALTRDGKHLLVANHLHDGAANGRHVAATISVIDTHDGKVVRELLLPNGSGAVQAISVSPDGRYAAATHVLGRFNMPTTQLDRGWMNTNAKTLIDLERMEVLNTVLLDTVDRGAANPWGVAWSEDGKVLAVSLAGSHEVSLTDFPALLKKLEALADPTAPPRPYTAVSRTPEDVPNDLSFLVGIRQRVALGERNSGPRGLAILGGVTYAANYFSDTLSLVSVEGGRTKVRAVALGPCPQLSEAEQGDRYFHDARICFQGWQSCASCHPGEARVDALNWDLLNDGIGNPKNNKSLLLAFATPPAMSTGVRESAEAAVLAGVRHILFTVQPPEVVNALNAYVKSLRPVPSPRLVNGRLSTEARRGEAIFRSAETGCATCHPGSLYTDQKSYDVGTRGLFDRNTEMFDTPTLVELWRTAPYLHDGSAISVRDVLTEHNGKDQHGRTSHLTSEEIDWLAEYLLSL